MCGISVAAVLEGRPTQHCRYQPKVTKELGESLDRLKHRGPDRRGTWIGDGGRLALGHVRLSIKDLSPAATQPLSNADETIFVVVNGEFFEYDKLYGELSAEKSGSYDFRSKSDSELLIALYERDGIHCLSSLRGEFAFVLYDSKRQILFAAVDRFGIKPLFWTVVDGRLLIASEAKAFSPFGWKPEWDTRSIVEDGWLHDERTMFRGVRKVMPGHYMTCYSFDFIQQKPYWEMEYPDKTRKETRSEEEMILGLREKLYEAVSLRVQGDVPIGAYLSGGLDSAIVVGILADIIKEKGADAASDKALSNFQCFCVGFDKDTEFDEMPIAERTCAYLGVPFTGKRLTEADLAEDFEATTIFSEHPNPDLNSVGKFKLSKVAIDHGVKVVLSGEGSDEHFGGYFQFSSDAIREPDLTMEQRGIPDSKRGELTRQVENRTSPGYKGIPKAFATSQSPLARRILNQCFISASLWAVTVSPPFAYWTQQLGAMHVQEMRATGAGAKALDLINRKWHPLHTSHMGDRMEMANSLEGRTPFLDHHLTEYANSLPPSMKVNIDLETGAFTEKWVLREAGKPFITDEMYYRRKHPFSAPYKYDVGGPVHRLFCRLITRTNIEQLGFVDVDEASKLMEKAFVDYDGAAMRAAIVLAQWIVLSKEFKIPKARHPGCRYEGSWELAAFKEALSSFPEILDYALKYVRLMF